MGARSNLLRPMSIGDILDGAISLYRSNFLLLVGIAACVYVPFYILALLINPWVQTFLKLVIPVFVAAVVTVAISERILGRQASIASSYRRAGNRLGPFIGALLLMVLIMIPVGIVMLISVGIFTGIATFLSSMLGIPAVGMFAGIIIGLIMVAWIGISVLAFMVWLLFVPQAVLLEGTGATRSIGRSIELIKGSFWKTLGVLVLVYIAILLVGTIVGLVGGVIAAVLSGGIDSAGGFVSSMRKFQEIPIASGVTDLFLEPFRMIVITLLYYDIRVRKEAYDTELMAEELAIEVDSSDERDTSL
ncbi:hypothetical protein ACFL6S_19755 [Candidatus Poribacteria bacterium]